MTFGVITEEDRQKAKATKLAKIEWAKENLCSDFGDDEKYWRKLASDYGVRLPAYYIPGSETKHIKRLLTKLGADVKEFLEGTQLSKRWLQMILNGRLLASVVWFWSGGVKNKLRNLLKIG